MKARIDTMHLYQVKGAAGERQRMLVADPSVGIVGDRNFAIARNKKPDRWVPKGVFFVCMNTASMAIERPVFLEGGAVLDPKYLAALSGRLNVDVGKQLVETGGAFNMTDDKEPYVSFGNLATLDAVSKYMGRELDGERFRLNVWLSGLDPFVELDFVPQHPGTMEFSVGAGRFRAEDMLERCKAVEASPILGTYDADVLAALEEMLKARGYKGSPKRGKFAVMGFLARPLTLTQLEEGMPVEF